MKTKMRIIKNEFVLSAIKKIVTILTSVAMTSLISRYLGPDIKGEYSYFLSLLNISVIISQFGYYKLYSRDRRGGLKNASSIYFSFVIIKAIALMAIGILFFIIMKALGAPNYLLFLPFLTVILTISSELTFMLLIDHYEANIYISMVIPVINILLLLFAYFFVESSVVSVLIVIAIKEILSIVLCTRFGKYKFMLSMDLISFFQSNMRVVIYPVIAALLLDFNYKIDVVFLKHLSTDYIVGIYASAVNLSEIAWMFPDIFKDVLFNKTAKSDSIDSINLSLRYSNLIIIIFSFFIILFGKIVITILFGVDYLDSYGISLVLLLGIHSMSTFKILNPLYQAKGEWKTYTSTLLVGAIANVILNYALIPYIGGFGAAIASVVSYAICGGKLVIHYAKEYNIPCKELMLPTRIEFKNLLSLLLLPFKNRCVK